MGSSLAGMSRPTRRRLVRLERRSRDPLIVRRASAVRRLGEGRSVTEVSTEMAAARSSVQNWRDLFLREGEAGLQPLRRGAPQRTVTAGLTAQLMALVPQSPRDLGYLRNTWTSELLAKELARQHRQTLHASTVRRLLPKLGWVWRRSRPTLHIRDPRYPVRMAAIHRAIAQAARPDTAVLHVDEADINLNPKLGAMWSRRGGQVAIPTPGQNRKRYLAGALDAHRGTILYTEGESKDTDLFLRLLEVAERHHGRRFKRLYVILDNYGIHSSRIARAWLTNHPRIRLLFQPAHHPWVNAIERLWKAMHDTVTRNHRYSTLDQLMRAVRRFLHVAQPFPGSQHALARA